MTSHRPQTSEIGLIWERIKKQKHWVDLYHYRVVVHTHCQHTFQLKKLVKVQKTFSVGFWMLTLNGIKTFILNYCKTSKCRSIFPLYCVNMDVIVEIFVFDTKCVLAALRDCKCFIAVAVCHGCSRRAGDPVKFAAMQTSLLSFLHPSAIPTKSLSSPCSQFSLPVFSAKFSNVHVVLRL